VGNVSPKQDTKKMWQPPASCILYLPPCHSLLVKDMPKKPMGHTYCLSHARSIPVKYWCHLNLCERLDFIARPRWRKKWLACSLIRERESPKCFITALSPAARP